MSFRLSSNRMLHGFGWSAAFSAVTRVSTVVAVPLVLHGLGGDLYAVWVIAGSLVMIQSLFDLGVASAVVRYAAVAAADTAGGRAAVLRIAARATVFYMLLSAVVFLPMWFGARSMVSLMHFVKPTEIAAGVVIVRWAAVAFALTNLTLVAASILQGIDRVGASYRDQTAGWLLYLPLLLVGMRWGSPAQAVGVAWVGAYGVQTFLLGRSLIVGIRGVPMGDGTTPAFREMLSLGSRWQVSAWADFATFQLPRFIAGAALSSGAVISLDVAIRAGQLMVAPLFAFYPTIVPRAASLLARGGMPALRAFVQRWYGVGVLLLALGACVFIPVEVPLLSIWTGRPVAAFNPLVTAAVLVGTAAHASTGLLSSALLVRGHVKPVVAYKSRQLLLAAALLTVAAPIGLVAVALALCAALGLPAVAFNVRASKEMGVRLSVPAPMRLSLSASALAQVAIPMGLVMAARSVVGPWQLLGIASIAVLACLVLASLLFMRRTSAKRCLEWLVALPASVYSPATGDHLLRK